MLKHEYGKLFSDCTSLKIGGPAFRWLEPEDFDDVLEAISTANSDNRPLAVVGKGTNILSHDEGFDGVVIKLGQGFDYIEREDDGIYRIGSAVSISRLVRQCNELGFGGCEFLAGIPGSFGGAVFMNAGVRDIKTPDINKEVKDIVIDVDVVDLKDKTRKNLRREAIDFRYRSSGLDGKCILGARVKLEKEKADTVKSRVDSFMKRRGWIRRLGFPSAGSVFKNPDERNSAGRLIEDCGLKGRRIGGAMVSRIHANVIVNVGGATSKDISELIDLVRHRVKERFGIELELELKIL